jgi:AAA family ATP:ADP antiporter
MADQSMKAGRSGSLVFLPCTREQKYSAKQAIDSFFVRMGDVLTALLVFVGTTYLSLGARGFAKFNILLVLLWLGFAVWVGREYSRLVKTGEKPR